MLESYQKCVFFAFLTVFNALTFFGYAQNIQLKNNKAYLDKVKYYRYLNPDSAKYFVAEGIAKAEGEKDLLGLAALLNQSGMIDDNAAQFKESRKKYLRSEQIYQQLKDSIGLAFTQIRLGMVEQRKANYGKSFKYSFNALKISENIKNKQGVLEARVTLSDTYYRIGEYKNSIAQLDIAQRINSQLPLSNVTLNMYINLGRVYTKLKRFDEAIEDIEIGLSKCNKVEYSGFKISLLTLLANVYYEKGDNEKAIALLNEALSFSIKIKNVIRELTCLLDLSNIHREKSTDLALSYLGAALKIAEGYKLYNHQIDILNSMSILYQKNEQFEKALLLKNKAYQLATKFYYDDMKAQVSNLETAYDNEKTNVQVRELQLKNTREKQVKNIILAIAIATFLLLIVTASYYYRSKHLNKLFKYSNLKLEESNRQKDKFFSIVAHDIRSPLVSTTSVLQLIKDDELDQDTKRDIVGKLILHCDSSLEILDNLLKWGQMQIKGVSLNQTTFDPLANISRNIALLKEALDQKQIDLAVDVPQRLLIVADQNHFDFVVRNLMANAIKFTPANGKIKLTAEIITGGFVEFNVVDNGVGISPSRIKSIFELSSISTKGTSQEEGTSLGLIICKEFILANSGIIDVESQVGNGTKFIFTLKGRLTTI